MGAYFFFAAAFRAGLAGAFAFAFFLSLPCELLPLAIVKSFREMCCASTTACCTYDNKFAPHIPQAILFKNTWLLLFSEAYNKPLESIFHLEIWPRRAGFPFAFR